MQDHVPSVLKDFLGIGIKIWVLTGDKPDTSLSIAFSCKLLTHEFIIFELKDSSVEELDKLIQANLETIVLNPSKKYGLVVVTEALNLITSDISLTDKVFLYHNI